MTLDYLRKGPVSVIFSKEDDEKTRAFLKECYGKIERADNPIRKKSFKCSWCIGYDECSKIREQYLDKNGRFVMPPASDSKDYKPTKGRKLPEAGK